MYKSFRSNAHYLTRYHVLSGAFWAIAAATALALTSDLNVWFVPSFLLLASVDVRRVTLGALSAIAACSFTTPMLLPQTIALSVAMPFWVVFATSLLHNAAHGNFKPRWLNRVVGEIFGVFQLVGFPDWVIVHVIHHAHPDDPERDPHPPLNQSFGAFLVGMRTSILQVLLKDYFALHGRSQTTQRSLVCLTLASKVEQVAKILFCYAVMGPHAFAFFFAPSIALKMVHYAWFNYATHLPQEAETEIVNRSKGLYRLINVFSFGLYYHRNHHQNPKLFNPSKMNTPAQGAPEQKAA